MLQIVPFVVESAKNKYLSDPPAYIAATIAPLNNIPEKKSPTTYDMCFDATIQPCITLTPTSKNTYASRNTRSIQLMALALNIGKNRYIIVKPKTKVVNVAFP